LRTQIVTSRSLLALLAAALLLSISASTAAAHVVLQSSSPAAGANLQVAPSSVTITFDDELDPDLSTFTVTGPGTASVGSGSIDLTVADRNVMSGLVTITEPGIYTVTYHVAGVDGHQLGGSFSFGYRTALAIPNPTGGEGPDTAMGRPAGSSAPVLMLGVLVVLVGALAVRLAGEARR
jgi:methionine-rich copper-binding protein CopC